MQQSIMYGTQATNDLLTIIIQLMQGDPGQTLMGWTQGGHG